MDDLFVSVNVPVRLIGSHGRNLPGFKSARHGTFVSAIDDPPHFIEQVSFSNLTVLTVALDNLSIGLPSADNPSGWQNLTVCFKAPQSGEAIQAFVTNLAIALSASYARNGILGMAILWLRLIGHRCA